MIAAKVMADQNKQLNYKKHSHAKKPLNHLLLDLSTAVTSSPLLAPPSYS